MNIESIYATEIRFCGAICKHISKMTDAERKDYDSQIADFLYYFEESNQLAA